MLRDREHPKNTSSLSEGTTLETSQSLCPSYILECGGYKHIDDARHIVSWRTSLSSYECWL